VGKVLAAKRNTLAIAESCTGGLISSRVTDVPGSSRYFRMGVVAYSDDAKISQLCVSPGTIYKYGAVSRQTALEMAKNIREISGADIGLSVTGIAGPGGGAKAKSVGLVYIALAMQGKAIWKEFHFRGERKVIKFRSSQAALDLLKKTL
jgi:nicotinamide-nucleotide amidase